MRTAEEIAATIPKENKHGDCFEIHLKLLPLQPEYKLVHGIVTGQGPIEGIKLCHCWIERTTATPFGDVVMVMDFSNGNSHTMSAKTYYKIGEIDPDSIVRYDPLEARGLADIHGHYGPWHQLPIDVC
ncbi:hypothetical protein ABXV18_24690 [Vibrio owensii]|uniref:hypothetical protein n=1 Tax=Vibrio owensii TaxID=696485 RepID=UPI00339703AC